MAEKSSLRLFDLCGWSHVQLTGPDCRSFLQSFCTNDVVKLESGQSCEAFIPNLKGRILAHVIVLAGESSLNLIAGPGADAVLVPHLNKYLLGLDAEIVDLTAMSRLLCLVGSKGVDASGIPEGLQQNHWSAWNVGDGEVKVASLDLFREPSWWVAGPSETIAALEQRWIAEGIPKGPDEEFDSVRIASGFPIIGRDLSQDNIAQEAARTERAISFRKGCYLGQEPIARLDALGHTNKELRGLLIHGEISKPGGEVLLEEQGVGRVTSVSPWDEGQTIALAVIRTKATTPGTLVAVTGETGTFPAEVFWPHIE